MFEKEAKEYACEYARQYLHNDGSGLTNSYCETYNGYYRGANDGYNKANEWHYVKDGDLPKEQQLVLLYRKNPNGANVALAYWYKSYVNDEVIAWKEIILPEEE